MKENYIGLTKSYDDVLFKKKLLQVTDEKSISIIREMTEQETTTFVERLGIEGWLKLVYIRGGFDSYYDLILGLMEMYDFDIKCLSKNTFILDKLRAEKSRLKHEDIMGLFE